jgi:ParB-like chromosome segregation protein Spo0J
MKIERIVVEDVDVGNRLRPINERTAVALAESMQRLGQLSPISVYRLDDETFRLVAGLHRLEAAKRLGWIDIEAVFSTGNEIERELQEIAENLHRSELTALERDTQIGRWAELTAAKVGQVDPPSGGAQPAEKGVRKVARELSLERKDVARAVKVASISPAAKQAARDAGLGNNRTALLAVPKKPRRKLRSPRYALSHRPRLRRRRRTSRPLPVPSKLPARSARLIASLNFAALTRRCTSPRSSCRASLRRCAAASPISGNGSANLLRN